MVEYTSVCACIYIVCVVVILLYRNYPHYKLNEEMYMRCSCIDPVGEVALSTFSLIKAKPEDIRIRLR